jgi:predicted DNA-binding protein with PD1-like motif
MKAKKFNNKYFIRIDKGEEIVETLKKFCEKENIKLGSIVGIGATDRVKVGLFDVEKKEYHASELKDNFEITSLCGNISTMDKDVYLHLHINLCDSEHKCFGGHLNYAYVSATFEGVVEIIEGKIDRYLDDDIGLNLLDL